MAPLPNSLWGILLPRNNQTISRDIGMVNKGTNPQEWKETTGPIVKSGGQHLCSNSRYGQPYAIFFRQSRLALKHCTYVLFIVPVESLVGLFDSRVLEF